MMNDWSLDGENVEDILQKIEKAQRRCSSWRSQGALPTRILQLKPPFMRFCHNIMKWGLQKYRRRSYRWLGVPEPLLLVTMLARRKHESGTGHASQHRNNFNHGETEMVTSCGFTEFQQSERLFWGMRVTTQFPRVKISIISSSTVIEHPSSKKQEEILGAEPPIITLTLTTAESRLR